MSLAYCSGCIILGDGAADEAASQTMESSDAVPSEAEEGDGSTGSQEVPSDESSGADASSGGTPTSGATTSSSSSTSDAPPDSTSTSAGDTSASDGADTTSTAGATLGSASESSTTASSSESGSSSTGGLSTGCGGTAPEPLASVDVAGVERTFVLRLPPDYDPTRAYPLVFAWHGLGGSGAGAQRYFGIDGLGQSDAILVYPDALALESQNGQTGWDLGFDGSDFAFFDALLGALETNYCIDRDRIFSTGHSFGGYMSNALGCGRGDVLRAIAPVAGGGPWSQNLCVGSVDVWLTHGTEDKTVEFDQGEFSRDVWIERNACGTTTTPTEPSPCVRYDGCEVVWCPHGGEHEWPDFAGAAIWAYFMAR